jgi:hypothetical protein
MAFFGIELKINPRQLNCNRVPISADCASRKRFKRSRASMKGKNEARAASAEVPAIEVRTRRTETSAPIGARSAGEALSS